MWRMRAASPASCTCMPKSTKLATTCACACAWLSPPITPNDTHGLPSFMIIAGTSVCSGRLCGPI